MYEIDKNLINKKNRWNNSFDILNSTYCVAM